MGKSKEITIGDDHSGISIVYVKSRGVLRISGWYDRYVGIEGRSMTVQDFIEALGIKL